MGVCRAGGESSAGQYGRLSSRDRDSQYAADSETGTLLGREGRARASDPQAGVAVIGEVELALLVVSERLGGCKVNGGDDVRNNVGDKKRRGARQQAMHMEWTMLTPTVARVLGEQIFLPCPSKNDDPYHSHPHEQGLIRRMGS